MKALLAGMIVGALVATAINSKKSSAQNMIRKGKRAVVKRVEEMLNV